MRRKSPSLVWQFFDRVIENDRCFAVTCKLCDSEYKYFGNTTNLRVHLNHKHPIQWELIQNGNLENSTLRALEQDDSSQSKFKKKRKFSSHKETNEDTIQKFDIQTVIVSENSETECEENVTEEGIHIMSELNGANEEWLEETFETYEPKEKKYRYPKIKQEVSPTPKRILFKTKDKTFTKPNHKQVIVGPRNDEYSVFGEYVASKLRKLDNKRTRSNVQQLVSTLMWQAEYGIYDDPDVIKQVIKNCFTMAVLRNNEEPAEKVE